MLPGEGLFEKFMKSVQEGTGKYLERGVVTCVSSVNRISSILITLDIK